MPHKIMAIDGVGSVALYKRRGNRSIRLSVDTDGKVRVTMPPWVPYRIGAAFAGARRSWIMQQTAHREADMSLQHGQRIGKGHRLFFHYDPAADSIRSSVRGTIVRITYGSSLTPEAAPVQAAARTAAIRALRAAATRLLGQRLQQLSAQHAMPYRSLSIKRMKTRWGSCDQHANIVLNLYLVQLPWEYIDYVILHELAHTRALHHGPDFWRTLEALLPDARARRAAMQTYKPALLVAQPAASVA